MSSTPFITVREAAARLRVAPAEIVRLARDGQIRSRIEGLQRLVYLEDVQRLEATALRSPAPPQKEKQPTTTQRPPRRHRPPQPGWLTTREAAALLGVRTKTVLDHIRLGNLRSQMFRGLHYIDPDSLQQYIAARMSLQIARERAEREGFVCLYRAARMLGCSHGHLQNVIKRNRLPSRYIGRYRYLAPEVVETLRKLLQQRQRRRAKSNRTGVAQRVEHRSPKPKVGGSSPPTRATE
jgi:excisionase family DNA binding protein